MNLKPPDRSSHPTCPSPNLSRVLDTYEAIARLMRHLVGYAMLWFTEDTQKQEALIYKARMDQLAAEVQNRTLFFSLWFKSLDDAQADRLIAASGDRRYYLEDTAPLQALHPQRSRRETRSTSKTSTASTRWCSCTT